MSETIIQSERSPSGPEKAAALLLMMGKPPAARLLKHFDPPDLRTVAGAAAGLGAVQPTMLDRIVDEFAADFSAGANLLGDLGQARNLLAERSRPMRWMTFLTRRSAKARNRTFGRRSRGPRKAPSLPFSSPRDPRLRPISSQGWTLRSRRGSLARCRAGDETPRCADWSRRTR